MGDILLTKIVGVNFNQPTFKMVGGLGIDDIKIKYNWFLNAEVKDAIIGEDSLGLVWYSGSWICGTWENGTWYSGKFYNGRWKLGNWYSYDIDQNMMMEGKLHINCEDISKSQFLGGFWEGGTFHYGIFGHTVTIQPLPIQPTLDYIINNVVDYPLNGETAFYDPNAGAVDTGLTMSLANAFISPIFMGGDFMNGWMNASIFQNGNFYNGFLNNSLWYNGIFYNGVFSGNIWFGGYFYGGDFSNGIWKDGTLSTFKKEISTRFGTDYKICNISWTNGIYVNGEFNAMLQVASGTTSYNLTGATWENGKFVNGEFHSKLNTINGVTSESLDHSKVKWENGTFVNGTWYGGTFNNGEWKTGYFTNGIINNINWSNGYIKNCLWLNGNFISGTIGGGIFNNIKVYRSEIGNDI